MPAGEEERGVGDLFCLGGTIRAGVLAGVGIGLFAKVSLAGELRHPDVITILDDFLTDARDASIVWPRRRYVPPRVRRVTDYFATALLQRVRN